MAALAEQAGYTDLWNGEVSGGDGVTSIAAAAAATSTVRLGTGILNVYSRSPFTLAMTAASLQTMSGGRFALGLGTSSHKMVEDWHGASFDRPLARVRDVVSVVRSLLAGERVDADGTVRLTRARLTVLPPAPVPIFVAALGPAMLRLAGEVGDGAVLNFLTPSDLDWMLAEVDAGAMRSGRTRGEAVVRLFVPFPGDDDAAIDAVRDVVADYATVPVYRALLERIGFGRQVHQTLAARDARDRVGTRQAIDDETIAALAVIGTEAEQRARLAEYAAHGADVPVLTFFHGQLADDERRALTCEAVRRFAPTSPAGRVA
jgi:probable F420-dependent oxidoreductase